MRRVHARPMFGHSSTLHMAVARHDGGLSYKTSPDAARHEPVCVFHVGLTREISTAVGYCEIDAIS